MKKLMVNLSLIILLASLNIVQAKGTNSTLPLGIKVIDTNVFLLEMENSISDIFIVLKDSDQHVLHRKKVAKNSGKYQLKFILSKLLEATYTLEVENDQKITTTYISKKRDKITVDEKSTTIFKPAIKIQNNLLDINLLNLEMEEVQISIMNENRDVNHTELISDKQSIHKRYNLSQLERSSYTLLVTVGEANYYRHVFVK